jgi:hypothetical protein
MARVNACPSGFSVSMEMGEGGERVPFRIFGCDEQLAAG